MGWRCRTRAGHRVAAALRAGSTLAGVRLHLLLALLGLVRRRRRAVVAGAIAFAACGGDAKPGSEQDDTTTLTTGSTTDGSDGTVVPDGWPERWFGRYYQVDENITVGERSWSEPFWSTSLNIDFEKDRVVIEYFGHDNEPIGSVTTVPRFELGHVAIDPPMGAAYLGIPPGGDVKVSAELRPTVDDADCSSMVLRFVFDPAPPGPPEVPDYDDLPIHRGRICLLEPLDDPEGICASVPIVPCEQRPGCCVLIDLCPGDPTPTTCDPP